MISYAYAIIVANLHARKYKNIVAGKLPYNNTKREEKNQQQQAGTWYSYARMYILVHVWVRHYTLTRHRLEMSEI